MRSVPDLAPGSAQEPAGLVEKARLGDAAARRRLFRAHAAKVHRLVNRLIGGGPEVDAFVETVFVEAFRSLPAFQGDVGFSAWLAGVAVRVTSQGVARRLHPVDPRAGDPRGGSGAALEELLSELPSEPRAAFVLRVLEGWSEAEIAAALHWSSRAVRAHLRQARRRIEVRLARRPGLARAFLSGGEA